MPRCKCTGQHNATSQQPSLISAAAFVSSQVWVSSSKSNLSQFLLSAFLVTPLLQFQKSTPFFWYWFLVRVSCKSGTGLVWNQVSAPTRTLFYLRLRPQRPFVCNSCYYMTAARENVWFEFFLSTFSHVCFQHHKFSFRMKNWRRKSVPKNGVDLWRQFLERVPWALLP